jgi:hypothetical protein
LRTSRAADGSFADLEKLLQACGRSPFPVDDLVPASPAIKATAAKYEQDDEDDQKCVGIHGSLLGETGLSG